MKFLRASVCACVCVLDVGMFYLPRVILFHLMTIPLDATARRCVKSEFSSSEVKCNLATVKEPDSGGDTNVCARV